MKNLIILGVFLIITGCAQLQVVSDIIDIFNGDHIVHTGIVTRSHTSFEGTMIYFDNDGPEHYYFVKGRHLIFPGDEITIVSSDDGYEID